jgi:hypothetical protein
VDSLGGRGLQCFTGMLDLLYSALPELYSRSPRSTVVIFLVFWSILGTAFFYLLIYKPAEQKSDQTERVKAHQIIQNSGGSTNIQIGRDMVINPATDAIDRVSPARQALGKLNVTYSIEEFLNRAQQGDTGVLNYL